MTIHLAVDAMGGDGAPAKVVEGVRLAALKRPEVSFILFGDEALIKPLLGAPGFPIQQVTLHHTDQFVPGDMKPSIAIRQARTSSMRLAIDAVAQGQADAVVSAGNTGAYMAMAKLGLRTLPGIDRPAIAAVMPTERGQCVMLDLGANVECRADNLIQFALMGQAFAAQALKLQNPSVGLLNVGEESLKGNAVVQEAHQILTSSEVIRNYCGFVEGNAIFSGKADVVVADGFTGNVALKTAQGVYQFIKTVATDSFKRSLRTKLSYLVVRPILNQIRSQFDPRQYNGGPFLGLNGIAVKSHGSTDAYGFASALEVAINMVANDINTTIRQGLSTLASKIPTVSPGEPNPYLPGE